MLFFISCSFLRLHFIPRHMMVNAPYYWDVLVRVSKQIERKWPDLKTAWILHDDNARLHRTHIIGDFFLKYGIRRLSRSPYSPGLTSCDFWLFFTPKEVLRGARFDTNEVVSTVYRFTKKIEEEEFCKTIMVKWIERMESCIKNAGCYFKGDLDNNNNDKSCDSD